MIKKRKIPLRICVGCQGKKPKKELIRLVRTPEGSLVLDTTGKRAGRGAYICAQAECLKKAVKGKRIEKNLQVPLPDELLQKLLSEFDKENQALQDKL